LLAGNGVKVIVGYQRGADRAQTVCLSIIDQGQVAKAVKISHCDPASVSECIDDVVGTFGCLDILVNNASMASGGYSLPKGDIEAFTPEIWTEMLSIT
jgi:3-oxoacyl-[acyl-carrier protein] reductase